MAKPVLAEENEIRVDLRVANMLAGALHVMAELRKLDPNHPALEAVDEEHFDEIEGTPILTEDETKELIDAIYNGSVLNIDFGDLVSDGEEEPNA